MSLDDLYNHLKMGHFARECRAPRNQDRGRRDNYRQGSKAEEQAPKALMEIDGVGWDWRYMANDEKDHALVADEVAPTEFALMANTNAKSKVFDNSLCSKDYKKNNDSLNSKITDLTDKLFDANNLTYHYKLALAQVESRLVEYKEREVKYCEKIRTLKFHNESNNECIEILKKKLKTLKEEKEGVDGKLAGLLKASKNLDNLIESQRFTWTFFLKSKDETSGNLEKFFTEIENLKDLKVKIISKPQDHCSTEVPEGNRNPNPTASTINPPADQMETLTVETLILTVSSPVPTTYSTDSQEPSSDARLVLKRVANQEETPSLDNILSLTNQFKDILRVSSNSEESNGVEANISNMETAITASPTPTLRIHKDHPKSQIIGPMDTPIQTRNKSKEVEEQSFIAIIY
nr:hypothetical protein [Tanacetum cinerariifolium]